MSANYIPRSDSQFNIWQKNLLAIVNVNKTAWSIPDGVISTMNAVRDGWEISYGKAADINTRTRADVADKTEKRKFYELELRHFVKQYLSYNSAIDDKAKEQMGITIRKTTRTPTPVPSTSPIANIAFSQRLRHSVHIVDQGTPNKRAKPKGVQGCEVWRKLGEPPKSEKDLNFIAITTTTPFITDFDLDDVGKTAYYWLRWINTRGEVGPWSTQVSAMVVG